MALTARSGEPDESIPPPTLCTTLEIPSTEAVDVHFGEEAKKEEA